MISNKLSLLHPSQQVGKPAHIADQIHQLPQVIYASDTEEFEDKFLSTKYYRAPYTCNKHVMQQKNGHKTAKA